MLQVTIAKLNFLVRWKCKQFRIWIIHLRWRKAQKKIQWIDERLFPMLVLVDSKNNTKMQTYKQKVSNKKRKWMYIPKGFSWKLKTLKIKNPINTSLEIITSLWKLELPKYEKYDLWFAMLTSGERGEGIAPIHEEGIDSGNSMRNYHFGLNF